MLVNELLESNWKVTSPSVMDQSNAEAFWVKTIEPLMVDTIKRVSSSLDATFSKMARHVNLPMVDDCEISFDKAYCRETDKNKNLKSGIRVRVLYSLPESTIEAIKTAYDKQDWKAMGGLVGTFTQSIDNKEDADDELRTCVKAFAATFRLDMPSRELLLDKQALSEYVAEKLKPSMVFTEENDLFYKWLDIDNSMYE